MSVVNGVVVNSVAVSANNFLGGPASGSPAIPSYRTLVAADLPITVNSGTSGQLAYYSASSATISGTADATISNGAVTLGVNGTAAGQVILKGSTSGAVTVGTAAAAGTWTMQLPTSGGTSGYVLQTDGTGVCTWVPQSAGSTVSTPFLQFAGVASSITSPQDQVKTANNIWVWGFNLPYQMTVTNIIISVVTADGVNNSDVGIYDTSGNRKCHAGAQTFSSTGVQTFTMTGGAVTLNPGTYLFAITSAAKTLSWGCTEVSTSAAFGPISYYSTATNATSGALPSSVTVTASASQTPQAASNNGFNNGTNQNTYIPVFILS